MNLKQKVFTHFLIAGLLGGIFAVVVLSDITWPDKQYVVLGFRDRWLFYTFPVIGALLSGIWSLILFSENFGVLRGALVGLLALLTFNFVLGLLGVAGFSGGFPGGIGGFLGVVFGFTFFGFIMFGWALVAIGALVGWLIGRSTSIHSNKSLKSGTPQSGAP